jgi:anthranilate synthase/aminodeoxychorismate synthase-like glutamine amidotransferase
MARPERLPHVLVVDNYDWFEVVRAKPDGILISPGPGTPSDAGVTLELIRALAGSIPMLGVCLGHQALAQAFGARIERASAPIHGKTSPVIHDGRGVFRALPNPFDATRYHSLLVAKGSLPETFEVSAQAASGEIMGIRHRELPLEGVQFHPESILTEHGPQLVQNWLSSL